jgi:hypothetical protein
MQEKAIEIVNRHFSKGNGKLFASKRSFVPVGTVTDEERYISLNEVKDPLAASKNELLTEYGFKYLKKEQEGIKKQLRLSK